MQTQVTSKQGLPAPRMRPFDGVSSRPSEGLSSRPFRAMPSRLLTASILIATVVVLVARFVAPEWGHALPALLITGVALPV